MTKKLIALVLIAAMLLLFAGCGNNKENRKIYKDTLVITNEEKNYIGCESRCMAVINSLKTRVSILEECENNRLKNENPDRFFLDKDYIYSSFDPFLLSTIYLTELFDDSLDADNAPSVFETESVGFSVSYAGDKKEKTLKFSSESLTKIYSVKYNSKSDSFRYVYTEETPDGETTPEFLEFVTVSSNTYALQSKNTRCWISFDKDGNIDYFICVQVANTDYSLDNGIFGASSAELNEFKENVSLAKKSDYSTIHEYKDGTLYYIDITKDDPVSIYADAYESELI